MANKPVTIKEIARKLRISPSTVSRALNDHPSIGLVTTERVKKMAAELGYEPNQTAIFFKQRRTFIIGVILPKLSEPFFAEAISAIENEAAKHNYTVLLGQSLDSIEREKNIVNTFRNHRVDGIIMSLGKNTTDLSFIEALNKYNIPIVFFDCVPEQLNVPKVSCDLSTGIYEAIEAFKQRGHQHVALINGPETLHASVERTHSFKQALERCGLPFHEDYVSHTDLTEKGNFEAFQRLRNLKEKPSAVLSFNDFVTLDLIKYAKENNVLIGYDIHVISFANYPLWKYMDNPPLASIEQYPAEQASIASRMLFRLINNEGKEELPVGNAKLSSKLVYQ